MDEAYRPPGAARHVLLAMAVTALVAWATWKLPSPVVLAALCVLPLGAVIALRSPFTLCLGFILLSFFRLHEVFPVLMPLKLPSLLAAAALGSFLALTAAGRLRPAWTREMKLFTVFFAIMTLGIPFATGRDIAWAYWTDTFWKIAAMTFAIATMARTPRDFATASRIFVLAGLTVASVAIFNRIEGIGLVEETRVTIGREFRSLLGDPNDLALVLLFPMSFAAALAVTPGTGRFSRLLGGIGFLAAVLAVLATGSRGGLLGIMAVTATFVAERVRSRATLLALAVPPVLLLLAVMGLRGGGEDGGMDASSTGRVEAWKAAMRMAFEHPFVGVGINNFRANFFFYTEYWDGLAKAVHSTWFAALSEGGFIAFGLFVAMVVNTVRNALAARRTLSPAAMGEAYDPEAHAMARALTSGIAGFVVAGTFLTQAFTWPLYILMALSVAIARHATEAGARRGA